MNETNWGAANTTNIPAGTYAAIHCGYAVTFDDEIGRSHEVQIAVGVRGRIDCRVRVTAERVEVIE